jgi:glutathione S-transferase
MQQVPVLALPTGELVTESAAILIHLADRHPAAGMSPALDDPRRPAFLRWMVYVSAQIYALVWARDDPGRLAADEAHKPVILERTAEHGLLLAKSYARSCLQKSTLTPDAIFATCSATEEAGGATRIGRCRPNQVKSVWSRRQRPWSIGTPDRPADERRRWCQRCPLENVRAGQADLGRRGRLVSSDRAHQTVVATDLADRHRGSPTIEGTAIPLDLKRT